MKKGIHKYIDAERSAVGEMSLRVAATDSDYELESLSSNSSCAHISPASGQIIYAV